MIRNDGSVRSANEPAWDNRAKVRDFGLYRGFVHDVIYTDDTANDSGVKDPNEVLYQVILIGGERDGQVFTNARLMRKLGGFANFEEISLKKAEGITKQDFSSIIAAGDLAIADTSTLNGDVVYIQFLNGDPQMPVITGMGYHQKAPVEATADDAPRMRKKYNGIYKEITKDGEYTWSKDNGAYLPVSPNSVDPTYPLVSQFAAIPGQEDAIKLTIDNEYNLSFEYLLGLNVAISGTEDTFDFETSSGTKLSIAGAATDSFTFATALGTSLTVEGGSTDAITLGSSVGASLKVSGTDDSIEATTSAGSSFTVSGTDGIAGTDVVGATFSLREGEVSLGSVGGALLTLDKTGFVKLGNASGDVLKDILMELIKSLSTATYAGYGAPGSNVADFIQLIAKLTAIIGG